nr:toll/interleukin-1 receptor domain-containing protein [uncultured Mucilaginibacter sp.]
MSVFLSYSSMDNVFANKLALSLVENRIKVWLDKWEMQAGDSLLDKIQEGLTESSFLLVVLSENSVESAWCKKELNSGLMREIEEKKAHIIPIRIDNCKIPLFLQEKLYADFRTDFNEGLKNLLAPLSALFSENMKRSRGKDFIIDFGLNWGIQNSRYFLDIDLVTWYINENKSVLIQLNTTGNDVATKKFYNYVEAGVPFIMKEIIIGLLNNSKDIYNLRLYLHKDKLCLNEFSFGDQNIGVKFDIRIRALQMGVDNDKDILVNLSDYLDLLNEGVKERIDDEKSKI